MAGYAQDRQGFSLGFEKRLLEGDICRSLTTPKVSASFLDCQYGDLKKQADIGTVLGNCEVEIMRWSQYSEEQDINQLSKLKQIFHQFLSSFKHIGLKRNKNRD
jgi:hypothetical protein